MHTITSPANQVIKDLLRLKKSGNRRDLGLVLVDGQREIKMAIKSGWEIEKLCFCRELAGKEDFFGVNDNIIISVPAAIFQKISYKENPDGYLAVFKLKQNQGIMSASPKNPLFIVLENVEKPGNIGAIIRTATAVGASGIIVNDNQTDIYNPNVIRSSEGEVFSQNIVIKSRPETVSWLKKLGVVCLAAVTNASKNYTDLDLSGPIAIVLGSEARGLSREWQNDADIKIKIPMSGNIDSLNVSVAAAVISFEAKRQREKRQDKK